MHKMLRPKADVERLLTILEKRGLIDVETAFKTVTIGLNPRAISKADA